MNVITSAPGSMMTAEPLSSVRILPCPITTDVVVPVPSVALNEMRVSANTAEDANTTPSAHTMILFRIRVLYWGTGLFSTGFHRQGTGLGQWWRCALCTRLSAPMKRTVLTLLAIVLLCLVATPCRAQEPSAPGLRLRFPSFITAADADQVPPKETPPSQPQGGVPTPRPTYANQSKVPFEPTKMSKVVLYGLQLTFYEHVMRVATQDFTRQQLKGPFWQDWFDSVHVPTKWHDKDGWEVNYLGHAIHGGAFSRLWLEQVGPKAPGKSQSNKQ